MIAPYVFFETDKNRLIVQIAFFNSIKNKIDENMKEWDNFKGLQSLKGLESLIDLNSSLARDLGLNLLSVLLDIDLK